MWMTQSFFFLILGYPEDSIHVGDQRWTLHFGGFSGSSSFCLHDEQPIRLCQTRWNHIFVSLFGKTFSKNPHTSLKALLSFSLHSLIKAGTAGRKGGSLYRVSSSAGLKVTHSSRLLRKSSQSSLKESYFFHVTYHRNVDLANNLKSRIFSDLYSSILFVSTFFPRRSAEFPDMQETLRNVLIRLPLWLPLSLYPLFLWHSP